MLDRCAHVVGIACVGYTFGWLSSVAFGRHFNAILSSAKPRLFALACGSRSHLLQLVHRHPGLAQLALQSGILADLGASSRGVSAAFEWRPELLYTPITANL